MRSYLAKDHPLKHLEIGSEPTFELYLEHLLEVFREVHRVLRDDATLFVNMGDAYSNDTKWGGTSGGKNAGSAKGGYQGQRMRRDGDCDPKRTGAEGQPKLKTLEGLKPKDLMLMPTRVAMALQADGWYLRSMIPWLKRNSMPESVTDRPASAIEYVFMFSRSESYFWDRHAVMMQTSDNTHPRRGRDGSFKGNSVTDETLRGINPKAHRSEVGTKQNASHAAGCSQYVVGQRNRRNSDWLMESFQGLVLDENGLPLALIVNPKGTSIDHFATYPERLVQPFILAGTSERGCCSSCGAPWERMLSERLPAVDGNKERKFRDEHGGNGDRRTHQGFGIPYESGAALTTGWQPSCECHGTLTRGKIIVPPRITKEEAGNWGADANGEYFGQPTKDYEANGVQVASDVKARIIRNATEPREVIGWIYASDLPLANHPVKPCTVLDPFGGIGTTAMVATALGRHSITSELNLEYFNAAGARDSQGALSLL